MARILVVDDDAALRGIISDALRQDGYEVETVCNGLQALTACRKQPPDAMVLDLAMPVMDGPALMRTLREQTRWSQIPVLVISGRHAPEVVSERLGARACLGKPLDLCDLLASVEALALP
jgi:two-component system response regulator MprA